MNSLGHELNQLIKQFQAKRGYANTSDLINQLSACTNFDKDTFLNGFYTELEAKIIGYSPKKIVAVGVESLAIEGIKVSNDNLSVNAVIRCELRTASNEKQNFTYSQKIESNKEIERIYNEVMDKSLVTEAFCVSLATTLLNLDMLEHLTLGFATKNSVHWVHYYALTQFQHEGYTLDAMLEFLGETGYGDTIKDITLICPIKNVDRCVKDYLGYTRLYQSLEYMGKHIIKLCLKDKEHFEKVYKRVYEGGSKSILADIQREVVEYGEADIISLDKIPVQVLYFSPKKLPNVTYLVTPFLAIQFKMGADNTSITEAYNLNKISISEALKKVESVPFLVKLLKYNDLRVK